MVRMSGKLKKLKRVLRKWNVEVYSRVELELKAIEENLIALEHNVIDNFSQQVEVELLFCKQKHLQILHRQEILGCQESRIKWLKEGDSNMAFIHTSLKCKRKNKTIDHIQLEDVGILTSTDDVHSGAVNYFHELLSTSMVSEDVEVMELLTPSISDEETLFLYRAPVMEEVKEALWSIPQDSSLGLDGFANFFGKKYVGDAHLASVCNQRGTKFWKGVMATLPLLIMKSKYLVRCGEINFWYDNWLGDGPLVETIEVRGVPSLQVHSVFVHARWDEG
ncbi:uncharacterized protein LOC122304473 [Carya illinoinensis]|uniref:uncharacterized protein LOC122304473 n=1 Tax=Carya illinoinensis TaxID=32201 RepID=UPI001C7225D9|nr:uncharacterized protein LOC122304473 [Carya illinoinensis]